MLRHKNPHLNPATASASVPALLVACLCARWCGLCDEYRAVFDAAQAAHAGQVRFLWVDIEDDEALLGPVEVDDFPTLLIANDAAPLFYGPLTPQPARLARLLKSALDGELRVLCDTQLIQLAQRLRAATDTSATDSGSAGQP